MFLQLINYFLLYDVWYGNDPVRKYRGGNQLSIIADGMWYVVCGMWYVVCGMFNVTCGIMIDDWLMDWLRKRRTPNKQSTPKNINSSARLLRVILCLIILNLLCEKYWICPDIRLQEGPSPFRHGLLGAAPPANRFGLGTIITVWAPS